MKTIMSPIIINGIIIISAVNTFDNIILNGLIGKLFKILNDFPSNEIIELVIDDNSDLIDILDNLSNTYLGTSGSSNGSWSREDGCYKGGIFTGCKTSANHEIWERILMVTKLFVQDKFHVDLYTWSWPGSKSSMCVFPSDGKLYYDSQNKQLFNNLAKFTSSLMKERRCNYDQKD